MSNCHATRHLITGTKGELNLSSEAGTIWIGNLERPYWDAINDEELVEHLSQSREALTEFVRQFRQVSASSIADQDMMDTGGVPATEPPSAGAHVNRSDSPYRWVLDRDLRSKDVSPELLSLLGLNAEELEGLTYLDLRETGFVAEAPSSLQDRLAAHEPFHEIVASLRTKTQTLFFSANGVPIYDDGGVFDGYRCWAHDITELHKRQQNLEFVLTNIDYGIIFFDEAMRVEMVNDRWCEMWGVDRSIVKGNPYMWEVMEVVRGNNLYNVDTEHEGAWRAFVASRVQAARRGDGTRQVIERKDGRSFLHSAIAVGARRLLTFYDITDLRYAQATFKEERQRLHDAINTIEDGFVLYDEEDRLVISNAAYREIVDPKGIFLVEGTTYEEQLTAFVASGIVPDVEGREAEFVQEILQERYSEIGLEKTFQTREGRWIRQRDKRSASGNIVGLRTDVTDLKRREAALEAAQQQAEAADRAKSEFLANMSHEIRTPMNGVLGVAELLRCTELSEVQRTYVDMIANSGKHLLNIINDILDFSKINAGLMELAAEPFSLPQLLQDVLTAFIPQTSDKGLMLHLRIDPTLPEQFRGDPVRLRQILTNLIGNAVKFTQEGDISVDVSHTSDDSGERLLCFEIADSGIGIPEEKLGTIFEKFSQVDTSAARQHEGAGLGLSIAASLVHMMGGEITVRSRLGEGSVFCFTVNLPVNGAVRRGHPERFGAGRVALIADPCRRRRLLLQEYLLAWGFSPKLIAEDDALSEASFTAALEDGVLPPDLVLLGGEEIERLMRSLRTLPEQRALPTVIHFTSTLSGKQSLPDDILQLPGSPVIPTALRETLIEAFRNPDCATVDEKVVTPVRAKTSESATILVVEDNQTNQIVFRDLLETGGYEVRIAANGREGVSLWRRYRPHLILMDVSMPEMDGYESTRSIRQVEAVSGSHVPIIGVTAHALSGTREACLAAGMDDYVAKPIDAPALLGLVETHLVTKR